MSELVDILDYVEVTFGKIFEVFVVFEELCETGIFSGKLKGLVMENVSDGEVTIRGSFKGAGLNGK